MTLTITRPQKTEELQIQAHFLKTIQHTFKKEGIQGDFQMIEREVQTLVDNLQKDYNSNGQAEYHLIAKNDQSIIGTIAYGKANSIIESHLPVKKLPPEIKSVYIDPAYQGKGIGTRLFTQIISEMQNKGLATFCLDSGYTNAQRFWKNKLGDPKIVLTDYWAKDNHHLIWLNQIEDIVVV